MPFYLSQVAASVRRHQILKVWAGCFTMLAEVRRNFFLKKGICNGVQERKKNESLSKDMQGLPCIARQARESGPWDVAGMRRHQSRRWSRQHPSASAQLKQGRTFSPCTLECIPAADGRVGDLGSESEPPVHLSRLAWTMNQDPAHIQPASLTLTQASASASGSTCMGMRD